METPPPPASFGTAGTEGWGGSVPIPGILPGQRAPLVKAAPETALRISAGVASGLLIQKSRPTYPAIAKAAHVSGTVELLATVSKVGTIQDLQVVSGPAMLRQAAIEAVRTWRYQPYKVNNQPVEVQTTILVVFTLGA